MDAKKLERWAQLLYKALVNQPGFARMGDAIYEKLDEALILIESRIINDNGSISLRN